MICSNELVPRILRDIDDGVLALDLRGRIVFVNPQCEQIFGQREGLLGRSYAELFLDDPQQKGNDAFHQFVLNAAYQKEQTHCGTVPYTDAAGKKRHLRVTSSFLKNETTGENMGIVLVISDVTQAETMKKKRHDATVVFVCVTSCISLYLVLLAMLDFLGVGVPPTILGHVINAMAAVIAAVIYKKTDFSREELGLKLYRPAATFLSAALWSVAAVAVLILAKLLVLKVNPGFFADGFPFWKWDFGVYFWVSYIFSCILQEFLARSIIYGSIKKMFDGRNGAIGAILLSTLLFGAVHLAHGFAYMVSSMVLLGAFARVYDKHRSIWGVTIIHYVIGQAVCCLGFLE